ncbi:HD domain-containing protein [Methylocapsa polymorpha]|uniref:HD domain-containing protein n=1 Tax=Methylocapsa polymorpha TaxID=3080828 RepID=A0ABZ0HS20_9HYPH|nr:HD domain-containing protein [Methylocapsa sp. RX1]
MRPQRIRDPIHDLIGFSSEQDEPIWELVNTRPVQRLRRIKQLGFSEFVYPGATHTRFSHVIGAMQMARRMLAAFEKSDAIDVKNDEHELKRTATIAAALLHDVGHGPYSHVFEELCTEFKIGKEHEEWTAEIIKSKEIADILVKFGLYDEVISFFDTEKAYTPYSTIISSQMDCDRLDFLCRDRYFCGLRSSFIDLEWLFDSLLIEKVLIDIKKDIEQFSFVVDPKGLRVVEEFVISYLKMYNDVYYHKTTRAVQHMVSEIIKLGLRFNHCVVTNHPLGQFFLSSSHRTLEHYMALDDSSVVSLVHLISENEIGEATILAQRYLRRDLYKCLEIPPGDDGAPKQRIKKFIGKLKAENIFHIIDIIGGKTYKQYEVADKRFLENILVKDGEEHIRLHSASKIIKSMPTQASRIYFSNSEDKQKALLLLKSLT